MVQKKHHPNWSDRMQLSTGYEEYADEEGEEEGGKKEEEKGNKEEEGIKEKKDS